MVSKGKPVYDTSAGPVSGTRSSTRLSDKAGNVAYCRAADTKWFLQNEISESRVRSRSRRERAMANTTTCPYRTHSGDSSRNTWTSRKCDARTWAQPGSCCAGKT
jgi:hypothetical protein